MQRLSCGKDRNLLFRRLFSRLAVEARIFTPSADGQACQVHKPIKMAGKVRT